MQWARQRAAKTVVCEIRGDVPLQLGTFTLWKGIHTAQVPSCRGVSATTDVNEAVTQVLAEHMKALQPNMDVL